MLEKGIAYKKTQVVNWDPVDQTVLANEQVIEGRGWRTGAIVEKREIPGYYLGITQFAEELLTDLDKLPGWPERVKTMQANWIGKSVGVRFAFTHDIRDASGVAINDGKLWVFTTRADTIMGVTFCAVAAEHPLAAHAARNNKKLSDFIEKCKHGSVMEADMATMEKEGMDTGLKVAHPLTGEQIPVWVANYVLMGYGDGAVMAVPAHDERDFEFAQKYKDQLPPVKPVIVPVDWPAEEVELSNGLYYHNDESGENSGPILRARGLELGSDGKPKRDRTIHWANWRSEHAQHGKCALSGPLNGLTSKEAVNRVAELLAAEGGEIKVQWRLRDWGISRQRYWGCPIPIIHCDSCGSVPVPDEQLPVKLPEDCVPDGSGNPLLKREDFLNTSCPKCGKPAKRETDTMDTFVDSSWYYARYASGFKPDAMVDEETSYWMPVDQYIGGIEHAILHLLYSRFWTKVMRDLGLVKYDETFAKLLTQGMVLNHIYSRRTNKGGIEYFAPEEIKLNKDAHGKEIGYTLLKDGQPVDFQGMGTMSKSKRNGVDPQAIIDQYGADTARLFMMFAAPPEQTLEWADSGVDGAHRFLKRLWAWGVLVHKAQQTNPQSNDDIERAFGIFGKHISGSPDHDPKRVLRDIHLNLRQASYDYQRCQFNTVVSATMKILNGLEKLPPHSLKDFEILEQGTSILLRLLSPIAPHICSSIWQELGYGGDILVAPWPEVDEAALVLDEIELVLQVNGKLRGNLRVAKDTDKATLEKYALAHEAVQKYLLGGVAKKIIVVPGRLINVVV